MKKYIIMILISLSSTYWVASAYLVKNSWLSSSDLFYASISAIVVWFILIKTWKLLIKKSDNNNDWFKDIAWFINQIWIFLIWSWLITLLINLPILSSNNDNKVLYQNNTIEDRVELLKNIDKPIDYCIFNWKLYEKPINAHCLENDKYNAWLCDNGYYEASWDWEAKWQQVCVNKITNEYMYY